MAADILRADRLETSFDTMFSKILMKAPEILKDQKVLTASLIDTPLGSMIAIADEKALYFLEFFDPSRIEAKIEYLRKKTNVTIISGLSEPIHSIQNESNQYFAGNLKEFKTPLLHFGSPFQQKVWKELKMIPYGRTCSYANIAIATGSPLAVRAVGSANGANRLAIVIPCHRVINHNGKMGGYAGGLERKEWLLRHEREKSKG